MRHISASVLAVFIISLPAAAQTGELSKNVKQFVRVDAAKVVLAHVRVIDGTGAAVVEDRNIVIEDGKISAIRMAPMLQLPREPRFLTSANTQ